MRYITHYEEFPIYEPAEGGYYYSGNQIVESERTTKRQARKQLVKLFDKFESENPGQWVISRDGNMIHKHSEYVGDGESYVVERWRGSMIKGRRSYC